MDAAVMASTASVVLPLEARTLADAKACAAVARDAFGRDYPPALYAVQLAQWALESARGASDCGGARNYFGLKARAAGSGGALDPVVTRATTEHVGGADVRVQAGFRQFDSAVACFLAHARLLCYADAYAPARAFPTDPVAFAGKLQGVYATDPLYQAKLVRTMRDLGLISA